MTSKLFTVGPVEMYSETLRLGSVQVPYFRTPEFSEIVLHCESMMHELVDAPEGSRTLLLTASGTGAMEAAVINLLGPSDRALVIAGGTFGDRFCEICREHEIPFDCIRLDPGASLHPGEIVELKLDSYKALLVNAHETSTGVLYDTFQLGQACRNAGILFVVDAISALFCDPISMSQMGIDLLLASSQKALALPPGLSLVVLSPRALDAVRTRKVKSYYFGFQRYLSDGSRGQTPFTPAVGIILQLRDRLKAIQAIGTPALVHRTADLARHFRNSIENLPFRVFAETPSNALTALSPSNGSSAYELFSQLAARFKVIVTPNGGQLRHRVFRVGHMGNLATTDMDTVANALREISQ